MKFLLSWVAIDRVNSWWKIDATKKDRLSKLSAFIKYVLKIPYFDFCHCTEHRSFLPSFYFALSQQHLPIKNTLRRCINPSGDISGPIAIGFIHLQPVSIKANVSLLCAMKNRHKVANSSKNHLITLSFLPFTDIFSEKDFHRNQLIFTGNTASKDSQHIY